MKTKQQRNVAGGVRGAAISGLVAVALSVIGFAGTAEGRGREEVSVTAADSVASGYEKRFAFCVGINKFAQYPALKCAVSDAVEMANMFESYGFDEVVLLTDAEAGRAAILAELAKLQSKVGSRDLFVFYFAGHGMTIRSAGDQLTGVLVPTDCRKGHEAEDGISMGILRAMADAMVARHKMFITDACYSGHGLAADMKATAKTGRARRANPEAVMAMTSRDSVQILTAGGELDRAFESDGHGLFTRYVLDCLRQGSPESADGVISGTELAASVRSKVVAETAGWQTPQFGSMGEGNVVFAMGPARSAAVAMAKLN